MSYTEMFKFDKQGNAKLFAETKNAWRGAMAIWNYLEETYLPAYRPSYVPESVPDSEVEDYCGYKPTRCSALLNQNEALQEVWNLSFSPDIAEEDKIVLYTTFDRCLVKKANFPAVIKAFRAFKGVTSLPEQAQVLEQLLQDEDCIAVGWNQTSINSDSWGNYSYDEETEEDVPYNCLHRRKHYWITKYLFKKSKR